MKTKLDVLYNYYRKIIIIKINIIQIKMNYKKNHKLHDRN